jgi:hypothetical protein
MLLLVTLVLLGCVHADVLKIGAIIESSGGWHAGNDAHTGMELAKEYFETAGTPLGTW